MRILDIEQRTEHMHAMPAHGRDGARLEQPNEFGAVAGLDTIGAHFDDHAVPP